MSRIGKKPIRIPPGVKVHLEGRKLCIEGPKGRLELALDPRIEVELKDGDLTVKRKTDASRDRAAQGTSRSLIQNMIKGVTEGYSRELELHGVGFRAQLKGNLLSMSLGFSHPVEYPIPEGIKIQAPNPEKIVVTGIDAQLVGQVAADIRNFYVPEPYQGKGIRYVGEQVRRKQGKAVQ